MSKATKLVFALVVITSLVLSACGATATPTAAPTSTPVKVVQTQVVMQTQVVVQTQVVEKVVTATPVPPTAVPPTPVAKSSDTVIVVLQQEPDTLHPDIGSMMARTIVLGPVLPPGMAVQNEKAEWIPLGIVSLPTIDNGGAKLVGAGADQHLEATFKIKPGLKWHDGNPVTAADIIYEWKYFMDEKAEVADRTTAERVFNITSSAPDTYTIIWMSEAQAKAAAAGTLTGAVNFKAYTADYGADGLGFDQQAGPVIDVLYFTGLFAGLPSAILSKVPADQQAKSDFATKQVIGWGPYKFSAWKPGQQLELTAVEGNVIGTPKIKNIIFKIIPDSNAVLAAVQKGEVDMVSETGGLGANNAPELDKLDKTGTWKAQYIAGYFWEHIDMNTSTFPFNDVKVRQAVAYGIDKKGYIDTLYFGKYPVGDSFLPAFNWAYAGDQLVRYPFDKAKAKATLTEAGWDCTKNPCQKKIGADTKNLEFTIVTTDRADRQQKAQIIQAQLKQLNMGVNLSFLYGRGLFATCTAGGPLSCRTFQAGIYTWLGGDDPDNSVNLYLCKGIPTKENNWSGQNYPGYCDKQFDSDSLKAGSDLNFALSRDKRKPLYIDAQKLWTAAVPTIPLEQTANVYVARTGLKNFKPTPTQSPSTWNAWEWELSK